MNINALEEALKANPDAKAFIHNSIFSESYRNHNFS